MWLNQNFLLTEEIEAKQTSLDLDFLVLRNNRCQEEFLCKKYLTVYKKIFPPQGCEPVYGRWRRDDGED